MKPAASLLLVFPLLLQAAPDVLTFEAESATLVGGARIAHSEPGAPARAWVTGLVTPADAVDIPVTLPAAGDYLLELVYSADAPKRIPVFIDGNLQGSPLLPKTDGFAAHPFGRVRLKAGAATIRVGTDWGYADLDALRLTPAPPPVAFDLRPAPVNPRATPEARALHARLLAGFGRRTLAGQHESDPAHPSRLAAVERLTGGAAPALLGLDLIFYSGAWDRPDGVIETARDWVLGHGGIVTLSWHWLAPLGAHEPAWSSFSTGKSDFNFARVADENSPEHRAVLADLDRVAGHLKLLRDAGVPVLWRPLHEAEGGWFWWGSLGPDAARRLYRLMFDRFTRVHRLDNLLWVWTTTDDDGALAWYPGDDYVDILAADLYYPPGAHGDLAATFDRLRARYGGRKPLALGECGALPEPSPDAPWLWFLVWDDYLVRPGFNPPDHVRRVYHDPRVARLPPAPERQ